MSLSIGIVGLPNVGKSTLFNALLKSPLARVANFAFTTVEPNVGVVSVPDERLERLAEVENSARIVPATVKFVDIAGLIAGAHKGEGLGNKFLAHIREVEAIAMVVRTFEHKDVAHVTGVISPRDDIETIMTELVLADMETLEKRKNASGKAPTDSVGRKQLETYAKIEKCFEKSRSAIEADLTEDEKNLVREANFLTLKPFLYVFNVGEEKATETPEDLIAEYRLKDIRPEQVVVISAKIESELSDLCEGDRCEYLREIGLDDPGLEKLIRVAYKTLDLITFFTVNKNEAHAWNLPRGGSALEAAGKVHTYFKEKFIMGDVVKYDDFVHPVKSPATAGVPKGQFNGVKYGGWTGAKEAGKARLEGRNYEVRDGDVVFFHHR